MNYERTVLADLLDTEQVDAAPMIVYRPEEAIQLYGGNDYWYELDRVVELSTGELQWFGYRLTRRMQRSRNGGAPLPFHPVDEKAERAATMEIYP